MNYKTIKVIIDKYEKTGGFSFEYSDMNVSVIADENEKLFLRVLRKSCSSEGNGRPITTISDDCYPIKDEKEVTPDNWKKIMIQGFDECIQLRHENYSGI